jgi:Phage integrase family/Helix-turn-helix domain of resolvase
VTSGGTAVWWFTTEFGGPVAARNLLRVVEAAAETAGVDGVGVHTLRHSVAVGWLESGVHIKAVADLLGHSSISATGDIYGHTTDTAARGAVDGSTKQQTELRRMHGTGDYTITDLAELFNISRPTVYRTLAAVETVAAQRGRR